MEISLWIEGTPARLRAFAAALQEAVGPDVTVGRPWLPEACDRVEWRELSVEVRSARDEAAAWQRVQPALTVADPDAAVVRGATARRAA